MDIQYIKGKLAGTFTGPQADILAEVISEAVRVAESELVKANDFNELKEIVRDLALAQQRTELRMEELAETQNSTKQELKELAEAQKRTEQRMEELAEAQKRTEQRMEELAEAQKRTEQKVEELAEAQKRTEQKVEELAEAQKKTEKEMSRLVREVGGIKTELGGLSGSMGYALENEAYRALPNLLKNYGIELAERFVRREVRGEEINLLARGKRDGRDVVIVGESGLKLTSAGKKIGQLERKAAAVAEEYPGHELFKILVTHYTSPRMVKKAGEKGIVVIQSFEWL